MASQRNIGGANMMRSDEEAKGGCPSGGDNSFRVMSMSEMIGDYDVRRDIDMAHNMQQ